jgi:hypothetical protein
MADHLRKFEGLFTLSAQRMRIIVDAFEETLELGLQKPGQVVVREICIYHRNTSLQIDIL